MPEQVQCVHPADKSVFLFQHLTPNVDDVVNLSVACCIFQCRECGGIFQKALVISRGYGADGSIPEDFLESLSKIKEKKEIDAAMKTRVDSEVARILTQRKKENAGPKPGPGTTQEAQQSQPGGGAPGKPAGPFKPVKPKEPAAQAPA